MSLSRLREVENTLQNIEENLDMPLKEEAELYYKLYPRRFREPPDFYSPRSTVLIGAAQAHYLHKLWKVGKADEGKTSSTFAGVIGLMADYKMPTYWVAPDLCRALVRTEPPLDMPLTELVWPFPAMQFMLNREFAREHFDADIPFFAVQRTGINQRISFPPVRECIGLDFYGSENFELMNVCCTAFDPVTSGGLGDFSQRMRIDGSSSVASQMDSPFTIESILPDYRQEADARDRFIIRKATSLALHFMLVMSAIPELIENQQLLMPAHVIGKKQARTTVRQALWAPRFIGRKYRIPSQSNGGTHASPRFHWRKGYWRWQSHGPKNSLRKLVLIQAAMVNAPKGESNP